MNYFKRLTVAVLSFFIIIGLTCPKLIYAEDIANTGIVTDSEELKQKIESELLFYFEEVGHFEDDGTYVITNVQPLINRANSGDNNAIELLNAYYDKMYRSPVDFGKCILTDYFGVYIDILQGKYWDALFGEIQAKSWDKAAVLILKVLGKSTSKANIISTAAQIAIAAFNCRGKW